LINISHHLINCPAMAEVAPSLPPLVAKSIPAPAQDISEHHAQPAEASRAILPDNTFALPSRARDEEALSANGDTSEPHVGNGSSIDARDSICFCTPAPKIPRPRNGTFSILSHYPTRSFFKPFISPSYQKNVNHKRREGLTL
jgi:hypothetical protein